MLTQERIAELRKEVETDAASEPEGSYYRQISDDLLQLVNEYSELTAYLKSTNKNLPEDLKLSEQATPLALLVRWQFQHKVLHQ